MTDENRTATGVGIAMFAVILVVLAILAIVIILLVVSPSAKQVDEIGKSVAAMAQKVDGMSKDMLTKKDAESMLVEQTKSIGTIVKSNNTDIQKIVEADGNKTRGEANKHREATAKELASMRRRLMDEMKRITEIPLDVTIRQEDRPAPVPKSTSKK